MYQPTSQETQAYNRTSLHRQQHELADTSTQIQILEHGKDGAFNLVPFQQKLEEGGLYPLKPSGLQIFQMNLGKMCNQVCKHCHVDAGPDRKEIMTRQTMEQCLEILNSHPELTTVDLTGGAPEMNPHFRWLVTEIKKLNRHVMVRCNLTIILANKKYHDLPQFYREHKAEVISSLPFYTKDRTDRQRGNGVFEQSVKALQLLNDAGYADEATGLQLNLVYNPAGAFLAPSQVALEKEYKQELLQRFGIRFNKLYVINNMPISRYLDYLLTSGNYEKYMIKLLNAYNPVAASNVMCRNTLSIGWDGFLYDCDFNQMLDLKVDSPHRHISQFNKEALNNRSIVVNQHCFGCTAGSGSSCGGAIA
ncbi:MAG TPA: arsenosugar biosynthesis radical SAM (seleno)protein ArsS [Flavisolibacter sp.]|nr:arsenosugar biosynthesis radical SAM (seleno)protein ArsS [Flavisolibacter sp.]